MRFFATTLETNLIKFTPQNNDEYQEERQPIRTVCSVINTLRLFDNYTSLFSALSFDATDLILIWNFMKMIFMETGHALNRKMGH